MTRALLLSLVPPLLLLAACGSGAMFESSPSIRGQIRSILPATGSSDIGYVRIEGVREADTEYDRADVTINRSTRISRRRGGDLVAITIDSLEMGLKVEATFEGPVMESYPVRATAASLVVIE